MLTRLSALCVISALLIGGAMGQGKAKGHGQGKKPEPGAQHGMSQGKKTMTMMGLGNNLSRADKEVFRDLMAKLSATEKKQLMTCCNDARRHSPDLTRDGRVDRRALERHLRNCPSLDSGAFARILSKLTSRERSVLITAMEDCVREAKPHRKPMKQI